MALLERMREGKAQAPPNTHTFNSVLNALEKGGQPEQLLALLGQMGGRCAADSYSYSSAIIAMAKEGRPEEALRLLREMEANRIRSDASPYNAAITALERAHEWQEALRLLDSMATRGVAPDVGSYTAVMQALVGSGRIQEGFELLTRIHRSPELAARTYQAHQMLIQACRAARDDDGVFAVRSAMARHGLEGLEPYATALPSGTLKRYLHGSEPAALVERTVALCDELAERTAYVPQLHAVPIDQVLRHTEAEQRDTLRLHPEKKALTDLLGYTAGGGVKVASAEALDVRINFKVRAPGARVEAC